MSYLRSETFEFSYSASGNISWNDHFGELFSFNSAMYLPCDPAVLRCIPKSNACRFLTKYIQKRFIATSSKYGSYFNCVSVYLNTKKI